MNLKDDVVITRTGPHQTMEFQFKSGGDVGGKFIRKILVYSVTKLDGQLSKLALFVLSWGKRLFCTYHPNDGK